jgi:hypothetical protein
MVRGNELASMSVTQLMDLQGEIEHDMESEKDTNIISIFENDIDRITSQISAMVEKETEARTSEDEFRSSF